MVLISQDRDRYIGDQQWQLRHTKTQGLQLRRRTQSCLQCKSTEDEEGLDVGQSAGAPVEAEECVSHCF